MDCVSPIFSVASDLFDCTAKHTSHIRHLRANLECLTGETDLLNRRREDVNTRVKFAEQQQMKPRREVEGWLLDVGAEQNEVDAILSEGAGLIQKKRLGRCRNIRLSNDLGKRVSQKIRRVRELTITGGEFEVVAYRLSRAVVDELPLGRTVGLDSLYEKVCSFLVEDEVGIVGIYGQRGIGKTTLLKKINNGLLETSHGFDIVIWVPLPDQEIVRVAQQLIGNRLEIIDSTWKNMSQFERAKKIYNIMRAERFLLLLDDAYQPLDLSEIGVPLPDARNKSKVIITTRSWRFYSEIRVRRWLKVGLLKQSEAWTLFKELIGEDTLNSSPQIQQFAISLLTRCEGLPSAIIRAGRELAAHEVGEWEQFTQVLEDIIKEEFSGEYRLRQAVVDKMPLGHTVGLDSMYDRVSYCLTQHREAINIGIYGTGGVGKTTLMKKINNDFLRTASHIFDIVIWVFVSKQECVRAAQEVIRNKLQIPDSLWQSRRKEERAIEIFKILKTKRFVLLLDDVWQPFDLSEIGVPPLNEIRKGSKVIITTRSLVICDDMGIPFDRQFRVEVLAWEDALALFRENVGGKTLDYHPDIQKLSEKVAKRCKGLPLALVTVGRAMANKISPEAWDQAIQQLDEFPAKFSGMQVGLFNVLKLSYDNLRDAITKSCFIYRSLFPKQYGIRNDELIEHWIGEGLLDGKDIFEARRCGLKIIEDLKNACLLEEGDGFKEFTKMHEVIHDMALWIAEECGEKRNKIWACESLGLVDAEIVVNWRETERISLWGRNIKKLPEAPHCSNLQGLCVKECIQLKTFPTGFFQYMPLIRVLDLSGTHCLTELPDGIDRLMNLEYINLSMTSVRELPIGMKNLTKLRCLLLDGMPPLIISPNLISAISSLQLFSMYDGHALSIHRAYLLEELESTESVNELSLSFRSVAALNKLLNSFKLQRCIRRLSLHYCEDLVFLELSSIFLKYLETVVIFNCPQLEETKINVEKDGMKGFEQSYNIPNFELIERNNQYFRGLRDVKIWSCQKLSNLTWLIYAMFLQSLNVQSCESMEEVISNECVTSSTKHASIFTRLTSLVLGGMPKLRSIYDGALHLASLEVITVINCPSLKRLPLNSNSATNSLKKIEGDLTWWESMKLVDGSSVREKFAIYFSPQYLADPIRHSGERKGKKKLVVVEQGSTSGEAT